MPNMATITEEQFHHLEEHQTNENKSLCERFLWTLVLLFIGLPVAFHAAWIYVLLLPLAACSNTVHDATTKLYVCVRLPYKLTRHITGHSHENI